MLDGIISYNWASLRQMLSCLRLSDEGFITTNTYGDGVIRMDKELPNGDRLYTFIKPDGSHRPPRCWEVTVEELRKRDVPEVVITAWGDPVCTN